MSHLAVKIPPRPHPRSKSSTRVVRSIEDHSDREAKLVRRGSRKVTGDAYDDAATATFVRKVLCAGQQPLDRNSSDSTSLEGQLPPLTSSNEIDLQIYAIVAVIIRDFVQTWYSRITPDHEFTDEVVRIIAHCSRGLEQRLRRVNLESLFLDEIPALLNQHAEAFRATKAVARSGAGRLLGSNARTVYHAMQPHPALTPNPDTPDAARSQAMNEQVWRQLLIEGVLDNLLPPQDLQNPCLKALVSEIFSEMIIGNVLGGKLSQGWFLWDITTKIIQAVRPAPMPEPAPSTKKSSRLDQFGLLPDNKQQPARPKPRLTSIYALIINLGWELLRIGVLIFTTTRSLITTFSDAAHLPSRHALPSSPTKSFDADLKAPILSLSALSLPGNILNLSYRLPWLTSLLSLAQHHALHGPGRIASLDARLDRLLASHISSALSASRLPHILKIVRASVFPNNSMAAGAPPPVTDEEIAAVRTRAAKAVLGVIPPVARGVYFGNANEAEQLRVLEEEVLGLFEDDYLNKHWVYAVVEVLVCRLFPEVERQGAATR